MSYGKHYTEGTEDLERGIVFMAYNASLAEQYEVIQRWINGGNSTGIGSTQNDPIVGVAPKKGDRVFRFMNGAKVERVKIKKSFVKLEWGIYLFTPSLSAVQKLCTLDIKKPTLSQDRGEKNIRKLETLSPEVQQKEWKKLLEDFLTKDPSERAESPDVWAAIMKRGGAYRIENGVIGRTPNESNQPVVLVGDEKLIMDVLSDHEKFSVSEQGNRTRETFGSIYVAQDPSPAYWKESEDTNEILFNYSDELAFDVAFGIAKKFLDNRKKSAQAMAAGVNARGQTPPIAPEVKLELRRQYFMPILGELCTVWFGIPDVLGKDGVSRFFENGGWNWDKNPNRIARCPGDYLSPSRQAFYPRPTNSIAKYGKLHGEILKNNISEFVRKSHNNPQGVVAKKMFNAIKNNDDLLARNLVGIMTGALPPMDGNLRAVVFEWLKEETLWRHQDTLRREADGRHVDYDIAKAALGKPIMEAMCKRPAPDLIYRTATETGKIGNVSYDEGDLIILSLVSASQQRMRHGEALNVDVIFGGHRSGGRAPGAGDPVHACPAYKMAMGSMTGILAALLDSGRIQALPSSLIIRINEWL